LYGCSPDLLDDEAFVTQALRKAVDAGFATLLHEVSHRYQPQGVTAVGLIAESHIAIHTWPEHDYAGADVFTCGERASAEKACAHLIRAFRPGRHSLVTLHRGGEVSDAGTGPAPPAQAAR